MDQERVAQVIGELADRITKDVTARHMKEVALVGIRSRGEILAQRLANDLQRRTPDGAIDVGALDITMYRDDLTSRRAITIPQGTEMNFRLDGRIVVLVDDVLQSGRSVRAALDALVDFGRPRLIRLAILVDRGLREFPIAADYVGLKIEQAADDQKVVVHLRPTDQEDAVYLT
jgi:pyrimidine operon attenuation protein/uracil phosphoribosyltransferase